jgi:hypothetical protein
VTLNPTVNVARSHLITHALEKINAVMTDIIAQGFVPVVLIKIALMLQGGFIRLAKL